MSPRVHFLSLCFSPFILSLCLPLLIHTITHHSFTDDLQLQKSAPLDEISELLSCMQSCTCDDKTLVIVNMPRLSDKTELTLVTSKGTKHLHNPPTSISIVNAQIPFKRSLKNVFSTFDCHLTMNAHVTTIARTCYQELRRLHSNRRFLTSTTTAALVPALVLSKNDYYDSLLFGSTHDVASNLQRIHNYSARVILCLLKSSNIATHLMAFH